MIVRAFRPDDLKAMRLQPAQAWLARTIEQPGYLRRVQASESYSAENDRGLLLIGSLFTIWPGRMELCALLSELVGPSELVSLHRGVRRFLSEARGRVEATVDGAFPEGHRWMEMLGFTCETPDGMRGYLPNGGTSFLYARFQE